MNTENLLYITTAFQPTASHKKASFIDFYVTLDGEKYHFSMARDCLGIGWIQTDKPLPLVMDTFRLSQVTSLDANQDQTFSNWFIHQLKISGKPARYNVIKSIVKKAIEVSTGNGEILCITRLVVLKEESGALQYNWEIVDGSDPHVIANVIGDPARLLTESFEERGLLRPPKRIGTQADKWPQSLL